MANLYIVATPVGNLEDITLRALRILKEVDLILCEDTRVTKKLLSHYDIHTRVESYHEHSDDKKVNHITDLLREGKSLALVTDAGTPGISDPGGRLVDKVRGELGDEVKIIPIPGASAMTALMSVAGNIGESFVFCGFVPHKKGRETFFKDISAEHRAVIFYESVHRIIKTLTSLSEVLPETRKIIVGRELTKMYEEVKIGSAKEMLRYYTENPDLVRGEYVIAVEAIG